ncbi:MAG: hypothetical protein LBI37_03100, partial [Puniceicoccales bacterium]|nr:hypothetical protein [Puniceicoccales bacterium]
MSNDIKIGGNSPEFNDLTVDKISFDPGNPKPPLSEDVGVFKKIFSENEHDKKRSKPSVSRYSDDRNKTDGDLNKVSDASIQYPSDDYESADAEDSDSQILGQDSSFRKEKHRDETLEKSNVGSTNYENVPVDRIEKHRDETLEKSNVGSTNYEIVPVDRIEKHRDGTLEKSNVGSTNY